MQDDWRGCGVTKHTKEETCRLCTQTIICQTILMTNIFCFRRGFDINFSGTTVGV